MDKKGISWFLGLTPQLIVGAILLAIILLVIFPAILNSFSQGGTEDAAKNNFDKLTAEVERMLESSSPFIMRDKFIYSLPTGYALVGFDNDSSEFDIISGTGTTSVVYKPDNCLDQSCLCLYDGKPLDEEDEKEKNLIKCKIFNEDLRFLGSLGDSLSTVPTSLKGQEKTVDFADDVYTYEYLYLHFPNEALAAIATGDYYLAKIERAQGTYVLITPLEDEFSNHYQSFQFCPENSDSICSGEPYDSIIFNETENQYYVCDYDEVESFRCELDEVDECLLNQELDGSCACGETLAKEGEVCSNGAVYKASCDSIQRCEDYCDSSQCTPAELETCDADPCSPEASKCRKDALMREFNNEPVIIGYTCTTS